MDEPSLTEADERNLRFLRILVLVLTTTMIVGIGVLVVLFATRLPRTDNGAAAGGAVFALPDTLELPEGATIQAVTKGQGWWAVVTVGEILIYDAATGVLRQRVELQK